MNGILTREGLLRRPGVKSPSSSLNAAPFVEKFKPFSPQYEYPDTAVSLKITNKQTEIREKKMNNNEITKFHFFFYILNQKLNEYRRDFDFENNVFNYISSRPKK